MNIAEVEKVFEQHWQPGWGSISASELLYIQQLIARHAPERFLEIGMASGLSAGLIARVMEENGGGELVTIDHDNSFFGDPTKENGFLLEEVYQGSQVTVEKLPFTTSLNLAEVDRQFDMAFIDANHQHPWPLLDTLCLFPYLKGSKIVIHHDLNLYQKQDVVFGIGPKYLYDQFPADLRDRYTEDAGNIFSIDLNIPPERLEEFAINTLFLPWSLRTPLTDEQLEAFEQVLAGHYSDSLVIAFQQAAARFNYLEPGAKREVRQPEADASEDAPAGAAEVPLAPDAQECDQQASVEADSSSANWLARVLGRQQRPD